MTPGKKYGYNKYFKNSNDKLDGRVLNSFVPCCSTSAVLSAARDMNSVQEEQGRKKKRQILPKKVKKNMVYYPWKHGIRKLGDGLQRSTQITPLKERLLRIVR